MDDLPRLLADALCSNIGPCCQEGGFAFDPEQCRAAAESELHQNIDAYASLNVAYDAVAARGCVDAYTQTIRACVDTGQTNNGCRTVFLGTLAEGAVCTQSAECISGGCTDIAGAGMRQCTKSGTGSIVHGKLGEPCNATCTSSGSSTSCFSTVGGSGGGCYTNDGLYCAATSVCAAMPTLGQTCTANSPCAGEAFCENGVCAAQRTSGSCASTSSACAPSVYCDATTRECVPRKASGATCTVEGECQTTDRCISGRCGRRTIATQKLCNGNF
jgi:hypothetical protein